MDTSTPQRLTLAGLVLTFCLSACATTPPVPTAPVTTSPSVTAATPTDSPTSAEPTVSVSPSLSSRNAAALAAITTAEASADGTAYELEWTRDRWEVYVLAGTTVHEVRVSPDGQRVVRTESERAEAEDRALWGQVKIPMAQAIATVLAARPGELVEADVDRRRGQVAWDVKIDEPPIRESYVDAVGGAILS